jgi:hypothetical protein
MGKPAEIPFLKQYPFSRRNIFITAIMTAKARQKNKENRTNSSQ